MNLLKGSLQDELDAFFKNLKGHPTEVREVSKAAFSKARKHLRHTAFIELNQNLLNQSYAASQTDTWHGYRLCAVDGSTLRLPNKAPIVEHFGRQQDNSVPQARLSQLYDVLNSVTIDAQLSPFHIGERDLAYKHLKQTQANDLIIYDRGYPAFAMYAMHRALQRDFLVRMPLDFCHEVTDFIASDDVDLTVIIEANDESRQACVEHEISSDPIQIRLIKVILNTGETEVLATSLLDVRRFPAKVFKDLYALRWNVEEDYKTKKHRVEIENFSGLSVESIYQDVHAKVFTQNMVALTSWIAQPEVDTIYEGRKHVYKINFTQALSKMKHSIISLIASTNPQKLIRSLVDIFVKTVEPIRKQRSYPRNKSWHKRVHHLNYKRTR